MVAPAAKRPCFSVVVALDSIDQRLALIRQKSNCQETHVAGELQALKLRQLVSELRQLDRLVQDRSRHAPFMRSSSGNFDARDVLRLSNELELESRDFERYLAQLTGAGQSISRAVGNRPPQEVAFGHFTPSQGGELAEMRALAGRLPGRLTKLRSQVAQLRTESLSRLNEPGRWGDAAAQNPVNELVGLVSNVLDLIRKIKRV
jgi:hypothetical protein